MQTTEAVALLKFGTAAAWLRKAGATQILKDDQTLGLFSRAAGAEKFCEP